VELLIVVAIMGVLAVSIASVFSVIVRTTPPTEARADDARSLLGISTWLPGRRQLHTSSNRRHHERRRGRARHLRTERCGRSNWDDTPSIGSGCPGGDIGQNLLRLSWRESLGGAPINFVSSYRIVETDELTRVIRVSCVNVWRPVIINVSAGVPPSRAPDRRSQWKTDTVPASTTIIGVEFEITTFEGDTLRVDASSRNPNATLSTIPVRDHHQRPDHDHDDHAELDDHRGSARDTTSDPDDNHRNDRSPPPSTVPCSASFVSINAEPSRQQGIKGNGNQIAPLVRAS
jgi:hypothetical protein